MLDPLESLPSGCGHQARPHPGCVNVVLATLEPDEKGIDAKVARNDRRIILLLLLRPAPGMKNIGGFSSLMHNYALGSQTEATTGWLFSFS
jgi:hypothetical protein